LKALVALLRLRSSQSAPRKFALRIVVGTCLGDAFDMRSALVWMALACAIGCGGSTDRTTAACQRVWDTTCAKFVECKVVDSSGTLITAQDCQEARSDAVAACLMEESPGLMAATDAQIDECIQGFATLVCSNICNQVPQDPAACNVIDPSPNTDVVSCQP
jgi:hypothetical protein